jgi:hypothetical protein
VFLQICRENLLNDNEAEPLEVSWGKLTQEVQAGIAKQ